MDIYFETQTDKLSIDYRIFDGFLKVYLESLFKIEDINKEKLEAFSLKYNFNKNKNIQTKKELIDIFWIKDNFKLNSFTTSGMNLLLNAFVHSGSSENILFSKIVGTISEPCFVKKERAKDFFADISAILELILTMTDHDFQSYYKNDIDNFKEFLNKHKEIPSDIIIYTSHHEPSSPEIYFSEFLDFENYFETLEKIKIKMKDDDECYEWEDLGYILAEEHYSSSELFSIKFNDNYKFSNDFYNDEEFYFNGNINFLQFIEHYFQF